MDDMEQKLNSILGNPQMMSQLMSMAQSLGNSQPEQDPSPAKTAPQVNKAPQLQAGLDMNTLQKIAGLAQRSSIDKNQQALLNALNPYLSKERIIKLEKAMRAAKIAGLATTVLGSSGALFQTGR